MSFGRKQFFEIFGSLFALLLYFQLNINIEISLEVMPIVIQSLTIYFAVSGKATNITYLMKKKNR